VICFLLLAGVLSTAQQDPAKDGRYYESLARKAYQQKDYQSYLANMKLAAQLRPNHPRLMFNLAAAYALTGNQPEALQWLNQMSAMGLVFPADKESDFDSIRSSAEFQTILKKVEHNRLPVINGGAAFTLHEKGFIPEGIAYDPVTQTFFLGSVYKRKIVSVDKQGRARDFATAQDGLWSVMGMKVDAPRRLLWVATAAHPQMSNYDPAENGRTGLFKFDLSSGKLLKKYLLPKDSQGDTKGHWFGDLVLNTRGDVFTTDSVTPAIYLVSRNKDELEMFLEDPAFVNLQGLDFSSDGKHLFVADYAKGLFVIDLVTRKVVSLELAPDITLLGIDGLYWYRGTLLAVQNGINPPRLVRLFLNSARNRVERLTTLAANDPIFDEPTLGVLVKNSFYLIAKSQWGAIDEKGRLAPAEKLKEPVVLKVRL
jgi:hypothetical protein